MGVKKAKKKLLLESKRKKTKGKNDDKGPAINRLVDKARNSSLR